MRIKELREEKKLSQDNLAKLIGTSQRNIGRWENEENEPTYSQLVKLADFFDVSIDFLVGRDDMESVQRASASGFSPEELELLKNYALLSDVERRAVQNVINGFIGNASAGATKRA